MALIAPFTYHGSSVERGVPGIMRAVVTHKIRMYTVGMTPMSILNEALKHSYFAQPGEPHPEDDRALLSRARAIAESDDIARIELIYERVPLVTYAEFNATVPIRTQNLPGTRQQIMASYSGDGWPGAALKRASTITYRCPMRKLVIGKAMFGLPLSDLVPEELKNQMPCVNDRPWHGLDKGYWLWDGLNTRAIESTDDFTIALCFYVEASFYSQVQHDWSYWSFLQLPNGHYVQVDAAVIDQLVTTGYDINAPSYRGDNYAATDGNGLAVAYPYPARDMYNLMGVG